MVSAGVNYLAVLVAGVVYFILGAAWYASWMFGKTWLKSIGKTPEQAKAGSPAIKMIWAFIGSLIVAYGIARVLSYTTAATWLNGAMLGALMAICLVIVTLSINDSMEGRPSKLFLINGFYNLIGFVIMGAIVGYWH